MSKVVSEKPRERAVTRGVREKVDNILQHVLWTEILDSFKPKDDELVKIRLMKCSCGEKQRIEIKDTLGRNIDSEMCVRVPERCDEEIYVFYNENENTEYMMLASEAPAAEKSE